MRVRSIDLGKTRQNLKLGFHLTVSAAVIVLSLMLFIYPAITILLVVNDSQLSHTGESRLAPSWFEAAAPRFLSWANMYLETNYAGSLRQDDIPATEWPMFGAVFFLVTAEDLQRQGKINATQGTMREAVEQGRRDRRLAGDGHLGKAEMGQRLRGAGKRLLSHAANSGIVVLRENHRRNAVSRDDVSSASDSGRRIGQGEVPPPRRLSRRVLSGRHALGRGGDSAGGKARKHQP